MKKLLFITLLACINSLFVMADEGMWIPLFIKNNEARMKSMGMKLNAEDIYSINKNSLKDAIMLFGRGCTGEMISDEGLLITNHHCGYGSIQAQSSLENDYLKNGFWAMNKKEELVNKGLTVTFLVRMEDVTDKVLYGVDNKMTELKRNEIIKNNIKSIISSATEGTHYQAIIEDYYNNNQYFLFVNEIFKDIRLVGAPPSSIGKFGGDTDNWMWPRHTGDFSLFRIYVDKNNRPAEYSPDNVPYVPKKFLPISIKGINKGDFTMVYGYPGSTNQFATSYEVELIKELENPIAVRLRDMRLATIDSHSKTDDLIRIQYASKYANIANGWKKWIGENKGLQKLNTIENKKIFEDQFQKWAESTDELKEKYAGLLPVFKQIYNDQYNTRKAYKYFVEAALGSEIINFTYSYNKLVLLSKNKKTDQKDLEKLISQLKAAAIAFHKNYNVSVDKELFTQTMKIYFENLDENYFPASAIKLIKTNYKGDFVSFTNNLYCKTMFTSQVKIENFLQNYKSKNFKQIEKDPAYILAHSLFDNYFNNILPKLSKYELQLDSLKRIYIQGLMQMEPNKTFYPDANLTLRITYGKIDGYAPRNGVNYNYFTTLDGIFEKEKLAFDDYVVHPKLKELYEKKDYGPYGKNNTMPVCFIASNHTTGGNSGSPVINGEGQLIGINFDRNWEGTMSDLNYDPNQCRNISLDMRYVLFIIDKFAGAKNIIDEIEIIQ